MAPTLRRSSRRRNGNGGSSSTVDVFKYCEHKADELKALKKAPPKAKKTTKNDNQPNGLVATDAERKKKNNNKNDNKGKKEDESVVAVAVADEDEDDGWETETVEEVEVEESEEEEEKKAGKKKTRKKRRKETKKRRPKLSWKRLRGGIKAELGRRVDMSFRHWPVPCAYGACCQLHRYLELGDVKYAVHECEDCGIALCTRCFKPFHTFQNIVKDKEELTEIIKQKEMEFQCTRRKNFELK